MSKFLEKIIDWQYDVINYFNITELQMLWIWWFDGIIFGIFIGWVIFT